MFFWPFFYYTRRRTIGGVVLDLSFYLRHSTEDIGDLIKYAQDIETIPIARIFFKQCSNSNRGNWN